MEISGSGIINDTSQDATTTTYSASKIESVVQNHIKSFAVPTEVSVVAGGTSDGTAVVANVQELFGGTAFHVDEVASDPGFDVRFKFTGLTLIKGLATRAYYAGLSSHDVTIDLYNYTTNEWNQFIHLPDADDYNYRYIEFTGTNYISNGEAQLRIRHNESGSTSHDLYIDYIGLVY